MKRILLTALLVLLIPIYGIAATVVFMISVVFGIPKVISEAFTDARDTFCLGPSFSSMFVLIWKKKERE